MQRERIQPIYFVCIPLERCELDMNQQTTSYVITSALPSLLFYTQQKQKHSVLCRMEKSVTYRVYGWK